MKKLNITGCFMLLFSILLLIQGCKKYLDVKSDAKLVVPNSLQDLQAILDDAAQMNLTRTPAYGESSADDFFLPAANLNALAEFGRDVYKWKRVDYDYVNDWSTAYMPVYNSNLCLDLLGKVDRSEINHTEWDNVKGSALFFRSYYFFMLTTQYGLAYNGAKSAQDPGIILRLSSDFNVKSVRSSVEECLERVIQDTKEAIPLLPAMASVSLRPSKAAAYGLLARTYLYMGNYDLAQKYADEALKLNGMLMDFNGDSDILGISLPIPFKKFNKETIFYSEMYNGFGLHATSRAKIDSNLFASYLNGDLRKQAFFRLNGSFQTFKGSYASHASTLFSGIATNELYLIRSESRAFTNNIPGAMADLNLLLKTRWKSSVPYMPVQAVERADALFKIREERRKELLMRNIRWADIKRYNRDGAAITLKRMVDGQLYTLLPNDPFYALPLPRDLIDQTGIPQNK